MSSDFNFFLNRQGVRGNKGEQGEQGYSPRITVKTETASEYILNVQNEDGSFDTPNLRGNAIENLGGTYVRYNQTTEQMYTGYADTASTTSQGEVTLSTYEDLESGGDESEVTTSKDVHDFVEAKISEASVNYVDIDDYTQKMGELDSAISDLDDNKLDFTGLTNTLAAGTNITITSNTQTGKITIAGEPVDQAQADWNQTDTDAPDYIKNKPTIPEAITVDSELSATSTNPVQNRLITNAINLISNEFENYATNKLDNLSDEGEARLHALKCYSDNGELLTDAEGLADVIKYAHSTFDLSKFTVFGGPNITDDGIASRFSTSNYFTLPYNWANNCTNFKFNIKFHTDTLSSTKQYLIGYTSNGFGCGLNINSSNRLAWYAWRDTDYSTVTQMDLTTTLSNNTDYFAECILNNGVYSLNLYDANNVLIESKTANTSYNFNISSRFRLGNDGQYNSVEPFINGSIDLKQFSITVDGVEVFSGNKTGIDTIKPDDYTVVGTPTISVDGVASGFSSSNDVTTNYSFNPTTSWKITGSFTTPETLVACTLFAITNATYSSRVQINSSGSNYVLGWRLSSNNSSYFSQLTGTYNLLPNTKYYIEWIFSGTQYILKVSTDKVNWITTASTDSTVNIYTTSSSKIRIGKVNGQYEVFTGSIDLNSFKIYVDGNLVYQPCLKIPYTESKTGSKIVNAIYRDRVNDMAEQFGSANYYTFDEGNGNFTLPQVELYGLIEKAASAVPSGVVQSSTINNIVSLTQAEYDALTTKDSNTFYVIIPST